MALFPYNENMSVSTYTKKPEVSCNGKIRYRTWDHAKHDAKQINRKHDEASAEPYHCNRCQFVHIGNNSRRKRKRGKK